MPASNEIKKDAGDGIFDGVNLSIGLVKNTFVFDPDDDFIDSGTSTDILSHECDATNYSRNTSITVSSGSFVVDDSSDIATLDITDITFSSLGGASNNTVNGLFVCNDAGGADTARKVIGVIPFAAHTTDGNDLTFNISELVRITG